MKAIIENGMPIEGIQNCFISLSGIVIVFHNNDLADKFAESLFPFGISYTKHENKVTVTYIN